MIDPGSTWHLRHLGRSPCFRWVEVRVVETTDALHVGKVLVECNGLDRRERGFAGPEMMVFDEEQFRVEYEADQTTMFDKLGQP